MRSLSLSTCLALMCMVCACGYRLEGSAPVHPEIMRVAVKVLDNKSTETGADILFTNALIREIQQKSDTRVVDVETADAVLEGTIKSVTFDVVSRSTIESVSERRVWVTLDLWMRSRDGKTIWSAPNFSLKEDYFVSDDRDGRTTAMGKIASKSAERLVLRMISHF